MFPRPMSVDNIPSIVVDTVFDRTTKEGRVMTFRVVLNEASERAIARATGAFLQQIPAVFVNAFKGDIGSMIDKGQHGMQADALAADGSILVGRPTDL